MTRRSGIYVLALLLLSLSGAALAAAKVEFGRDGQPLGNPLENNLEALFNSNCYTSHGGLGCDDAACEASVCAIDSFCCNVAWDNICAGEAVDLCPVYGEDWPEPPEGAEGLARILVYKDFADDNTQDVDVHITCTTGLPLEQDFTISEGEVVIFVLEEFEGGVPDCTVTETVPAGYSPRYFDDGFNESSDACVFEDVPDGAGYACYILNEPDPVDVTVYAVWEVDGPAHDIPELGSASLYCDPVGFGPYSFSWGIEGDTTFTVGVVPYWDGGTECTVSYGAYSSAVEASGCEEPLEVTVGGDGPSCTITFTVFFEGIPTVNRYGLAVLVLLMLGVGYVGFRRFV
jgi:hypothetical protein